MVSKVVPDGAILIPNDAKRVFEGVIYDVYQWQQELFDGSATTFEMLRRADTVSAVCIVDGAILVQQDDQPHRGLRVTFPGGRANSDEDSLTAIQREVHEETGYSFKQWRLVRAFQPQSKIEWFVYIYIAWDGERTSDPHVDAGEQIIVELMPFAQVRELVEGKVGYMGEVRELLSAANNTEDLLNVPEFVGKTVTR